MPDNCPLCGQPVPPRPDYLGVLFDLDANMVSRHGRMVRLTNVEYLIVAALVVAGPAGLGMDDLLFRVWPFQQDRGVPRANLEKRVMVYISRLRRKLDSLHLEIRRTYGGPYRILEVK